MPFLVLGRRLRCQAKESWVAERRQFNAAGRPYCSPKDGVSVAREGEWKKKKNATEIVRLLKSICVVCVSILCVQCVMLLLLVFKN